MTKPSRTKPSQGKAFAAIITTAFITAPAYAFDSGSTGADGEFKPTANIEVSLPPSGILNYTSVDIPANITVTFRRNETNTPVYLLASGNITIAGTINVQGKDGTSVGNHGDGPPCVRLVVASTI